MEVKDGGCRQCPEYTRAQANNIYCSNDDCDANEYVTKEGLCKACEEGTSVEPINKKSCIPILKPDKQEVTPEKQEEKPLK